VRLNEEIAWRDYHDLCFELCKIQAELQVLLGKKHQVFVEPSCEYLLLHALTVKEKTDVYIILQDLYELEV
jgi:hypothetical protein